MISVSRDQWTQQQASQTKQKCSSDYSNNTEIWMRHQDQDGPYHALGEVDAEKTCGTPKENWKSEYAAPSDATQGSSMQHDYKRQKGRP